MTAVQSNCTIPVMAKTFQECPVQDSQHSFPLMLMLVLCVIICLLVWTAVVCYICIRKCSKWKRNETRSKPKPAEATKKSKTVSQSASKAEKMKQGVCFTLNVEYDFLRGRYRTSGIRQFIQPFRTMREDAVTNAVEKILTPRGLKMKCGQFCLKFPRGSVDQPQAIRVSVETPFKFKHKGRSFTSIAPVLRCEPSGLKFRKAFTVTLQSSYSSRKMQEAVDVNIFVRETPSARLQLESTSKLDSKGHVLFTAKHFSDRAASVDENDQKLLKRTFYTLGMLRIECCKSRTLTWYIVDGAEQHHVSTIRHLHEREEPTIPLRCYKIRGDQSFRLGLESADCEITGDPAEENIHCSHLDECGMIPFTYQIHQHPEHRSFKSVVTYTLQILGSSNLQNSTFLINWKAKMPPPPNNTYIGCDFVYNYAHQGEQAQSTPDTYNSAQEYEDSCLSSSDEMHGLPTEAHHNDNHAKQSAQSECIIAKPAVRYLKPLSEPGGGNQTQKSQEMSSNRTNKAVGFVSQDETSLVEGIVRKRVQDIEDKNEVQDVPEDS